ncbi:hypothetical protein TrRE_jg4246 [Triparma retinervis]|uniref:Uncharacterized protein n=1 Tax=Triparma retinervis TaxID=2557542 RepID=A0A9W6ZLV4_9STRA|nr:hypothetical protein TrRE_jg4246 [Triparma retinervis]
MRKNGKRRRNAPKPLFLNEGGYLNSAFHLTSQQGFTFNFSGDWAATNVNGDFLHPRFSRGCASNIATQFLNSVIDGGIVALPFKDAEALEELLYGLTIDEKSGLTTVDTSWTSCNNRISARHLMWLLATLTFHSSEEKDLQFDCAVQCSEEVREEAGYGSRRTSKSTQATKKAGRGTVSGWG